MYLISKEFNAYRLQKPLVLLAFYLNPIRIIVPIKDGYFDGVTVLILFA